MDDRSHAIPSATSRSVLDTVATGVPGGKAAVIGEQALYALPGHTPDTGRRGLVKVSCMARKGTDSPGFWLLPFLYDLSASCGAPRIGNV